MYVVFTAEQGHFWEIPKLRLHYRWQFGNNGRRIDVTKNAAVAELADAQASGACVRKDVEVRVLSAALTLRRLRNTPNWNESDSSNPAGNEINRFCLPNSLAEYSRWIYV